jgi:hypothetical protein
MVSRTACAIQLLLMIALTEDLNTCKYSNPVTADYSKIFAWFKYGHAILCDCEIIPPTG